MKIRFQLPRGIKIPQIPGILIRRANSFFNRRANCRREQKRQARMRLALGQHQSRMRLASRVVGWTSEKPKEPPGRLGGTRKIAGVKNAVRARLMLFLIILASLLLRRAVNPLLRRLLLSRYPRP